MRQPRQRKQEHTPSARARNFPGICQDAKALGVHRSSLYRALTGRWDLPGLVQRYERLKQKRKVPQNEIINSNSV